MTTVVHRDDISPHKNDIRTIWRMLNPDTLGGPVGAVAGVIEYNYRPSDQEPGERDLGAGHEKPEFYFVLSGRGVVLDPAGRHEVQQGDGFFIEAGAPHSIWSVVADEPIATFFVALK